VDAGGFEDAHNRLRDFGADAVAGNQGYFVRFLLGHRVPLQLLAASF